MLIRHAEKPLTDGPPHGVTIDGTQDPESLTPRGWQRAGALVGLFAGRGTAPNASRLPTPTHLFASQIGPQSTSQRPRQTLVPLSDRFGLIVDSRFPKQDLDGLAAGVEQADGVVLIAWEHHLIPALAVRLATGLAVDPASIPTAWPDERYDMVWVFEDAAEGRPKRFRQVPELLLAGDLAEPIPGPVSA